MMNFTANGFIRRSRKLAILNRLKYDQTESDLVFPLHHKHRNDDSSVSSDPIEEIGELDVKQVVLSAYNEAVEMIAETEEEEEEEESPALRLPFSMGCYPKIVS